VQKKKRCKSCDGRKKTVREGKATYERDRATFQGERESETPTLGRKRKRKGQGGFTRKKGGHDKHWDRKKKKGGQGHRW